MDLSDIGLFLVIAVLAANQLVMRVGALYARPLVFYSLQTLDVLVGAAILWFGVPGLGDWPIVSFLIGLLFFLHAVQNNNLRATWLRKKVKAEREARARAVRRALDAEGEE